MGRFKRWRERRRQEKRDARAVEDWADVEYDRRRAERKRQKRRLMIPLAVVLAFFVVKADSCVVTRYNVFGVPVETEHTAFDHIDDPCGAPSAWDKTRALIDPNYNHCYKTYWWKVTRYEFVDGRWVYRASWWNGRECGAMTYTWRDDPGTACSTTATAVRG